MPIVITDADARRLLSIPEAIEAMRVAFSDLANGKAANPPRLRYSSGTEDPQRRYFANIHAGAVESYGTACVRAGSHFFLTSDRFEERRTLDNPDPVNWSVIVLYSLKNGAPLAFLHETHLSGFQVGATSGLGVQQMAREDSEVLGLFGTGNQAFPNCRAVCAVRPIRRVQVYSTNPHNVRSFMERMKDEKVEVVAVGSPRAVVEGADIVLCATNSKKPVFDGHWLVPGQMVVSIVNSDVIDKKSEVDETVFARASDIVVNTWDSVVANGQIELLDPIARGLIRREQVHEIGDVVNGKAKVLQTHDNIVYYKNNTGLAIQFAACGAILYEKMQKEGTNRIIPDDWFASEKYTTPVR
ncbi:MAG: ornithine cyclodeaminase family protein [Hyphomicrobiales bacterium]|nr:ornithine cyclodeaminase family protein [Hyphomicrobiales bacterium]